MDFHLSDEQHALVDSLAKFARAAQIKQLFAASPEGAAVGSIARWQQMAQLGLTGLAIGEEYGGLGFTVVETVLACEVLGEWLVQEPFITAAVVATKLLERCSSNTMGSGHLRAISEGRMRIAPAFCEAVTHFDLERVTTRVEKRNRRLRVHGRKQLVVDGAMATHFAVTARSDVNDLNAFLIDAEQPAVTICPLRGLTGGWLVNVVFDGAEVDHDAALFAPESGLPNVEQALDFGIVALCAEALGLMSKMLALTASYLTTRRQFGQPIGSFQALQHRLADMVVAFEQSRSVTLMAAAALTGTGSRERKRAVSAAKSTVGRHGRTVLEGAVQLHGAIGITDEYELSRYVRRLLEVEKTWGDRQYHEARFATLSD